MQGPQRGPESSLLRALPLLPTCLPGDHLTRHQAGASPDCLGTWGISCWGQYNVH